MNGLHRLNPNALAGPAYLAPGQAIKVIHRVIPSLFTALMPALLPSLVSAAALVLFGAGAAWATTDTTFAGPLQTVTGMVAGTGIVTGLVGTAII